jgi:hypothetical protein
VLWVGLRVENLQESQYFAKVIGVVGFVRTGP